MAKARKTRAPVHRSATIGAGPEARARIVVIADTHSRPHPQSGSFIEALAPDAILHAGDIGDHAVLEHFASIAPVLAVRGNIDPHAASTPDSMDIAVGDAEDEPRLRLLLTHIAVAGPRIRADAARLAQAHGAALIVCGHSHVPFVGRDRGLTVFNPGSIGPRRFSLPITFGVIELGTGGVDFRHVDCETGKTWSPPGLSPPAPA